MINQYTATYMLRNTFRDAHNERHLCFNGLQYRCSSPRWRDIDHRGFGPSLLLCFPHCPKHRLAKVFTASLLGRHTTNNFSPIVESLLAVESPLLASESLDNNLSFACQNQVFPGFSIGSAWWKSDIAKLQPWKKRTVISLKYFHNMELLKPTWI